MSQKEHVALTNCFFCGEGSTILLAKEYRRDWQTGKTEPVHDLAPLHGKVIDMTPCPKCEEFMKQGVIVITIDSAKSDPNWDTPPEKQHCWQRVKHCFGDSKCQCNCEGCHARWMPNPYRTGCFSVVREDVFRREELRNLIGSVADFALKHRWIFVEHEAAERIGFIQKPEEGK